jgi:acyl-CoA synthetase (AMP-forming)/AMP-acid ligase II
MVNAFLVPLLRERAVNLVDVWDPGEVLRLMRDEGLGVTGGATYFLTSLIDHPDFTEEHLALMPFAGLGGSTVPAAVMRRLTDMGIAAFRSYGSTEHPSITGCELSDPEAKRLTTDGHVLPGVEMRLDDDGEIVSRGPELFIGYTDERLDDDSFLPGGWFCTGDIGRLDDDGYLTITDRKKDVIIRGGENIASKEVEDLLALHPAVAEAAVVGLPDARYGERVAAFVLLRAGETLDLDEVRRHFAALGVAKQKTPEQLVEVSDLPRTASGKVRKVDLRKQLRGT